MGVRRRRRGRRRERPAESAAHHCLAGGEREACAVPGSPRVRRSLTAADLARRTVSEGYGVCLTYNLVGADRGADVSVFTRRGHTSWPRR
ncbi:hypothetical protein CG723_33835 [Streptomyces sp. CB01635]|nr:hypothetical protein CG723_33835 [Streptomyces sp. CB01635]